MPCQSKIDLCGFKGIKKPKFVKNKTRLKTPQLHNAKDAIERAMNPMELYGILLNPYSFEKRKIRAVLTGSRKMFIFHLILEY